MEFESIHALFRRTAQRCANQIAVDLPDRQITYAALEEQSSQIAAWLCAAGAHPGDLVAIFARDRGAVIAAILGTLQAGCAFVPLDPRTPDRRLAALCEEVAPPWLVTETGLVEAVGRVWGRAADDTNTLCLDLPGARGWPSQVAPSAVVSGPDDLCYIFFTSGSTGRPKGIAGRLKAIDHFIRWEIEALGVGSGWRVSQFTSPAFDAFLRDMFLPLCTGGTVCVPPGEALGDAQKLLRWIDAQRIALVHCVPSLFRTLVHEPLDPHAFHNLRAILMAGEPLLPSDVRRWMGTYGDRVRLVNLYGPSETTMTKFAYVVQPDDVNRSSIPIGKPIPGARAVVLDSQQRPCPAGAVGEIYIRTPFRSLGYYRQPELTSEAFIPNPLSSDPADIVYRTGDLGRVLADGNFEYLGRRDQQVKVRGVRVELNEVEEALLSHPAVKDVAVALHEDAQGLSYLCAYVVLCQEIAPGEARSYLATILPEYMIPSLFIPMDALPRTITGKVDRRALPAPAHHVPDAAPLVAPRTPTEQALADIWAEMLPLKQFGVQHNFFHVGGHSLLIVQLLARVKASFGVDMPFQSFLAAPTIAEFAEQIEERILDLSGPIDDLLNLLSEMDEAEAVRILAAGGEGV